jgi:hypothetical protein
MYLEKHTAPALPLFVIIGLALPVLVLIYFYITYSQAAWFFQDDFIFLVNYSATVRQEQLFDFTNFGRFLSRNCYWHWGAQYFFYSAEYFYIFNFYVISATSYLLYKIFSEKNGVFEGVIAGLLYFALPATLSSYVWLSNSQHLIGHFFVVLFIYLFAIDASRINYTKESLRCIQLIAVLVLGFLSNIFMSMVLTLPVFMILTEKNHRKSKATYLILIAGIALSMLYYNKLNGYQGGSYATSYSFDTLVESLKFYFHNIIIAVLWLSCVILGASYSFVKNKYFISWLFLGSVAFFIPFAFFERQRYDQYGCLAYLFFLLAVWSLFVGVVSDRSKLFIRYAGLLIVLLVFSRSLDGVIKFYSANPNGAIQKQQIDFLKAFDMRNPNVKNYCFRSDIKIEKSSEAQEWRAPGDWWFAGFGAAFSLFVNNNKTYQLVQSATPCDVVFIFKDGQLKLTDL